MGDIIKCLFNLLLQSVVGAVPVWLLTGGTTPRIQHQDQETTSLNLLPSSDYKERGGENTLSKLWIKEKQIYWTGGLPELLADLLSCLHNALISSQF